MLDDWVLWLRCAPAANCMAWHGMAWHGMAWHYSYLTAHTLLGWYLVSHMLHTAVAVLPHFQLFKLQHHLATSAPAAWVACNQSSACMHAFSLPHRRSRTTMKQATCGVCSA
jgi:hypothetical protein